jgi:hypothetical protein
MLNDDAQVVDWPEDEDVSPEEYKQFLKENGMNDSNGGGRRKELARAINEWVRANQIGTPDQMATDLAPRFRKDGQRFEDFKAEITRVCEQLGISASGGMAGGLAGRGERGDRGAGPRPMGEDYPPPDYPVSDRRRKEIADGLMNGGGMGRPPARPELAIALSVAGAEAAGPMSTERQRAVVNEFLDNPRAGSPTGKPGLMNEREKDQVGALLQEARRLFGLLERGGRCQAALARLTIDVGKRLDVGTRVPDEILDELRGAVARAKAEALAGPGGRDLLRPQAE